MNDTGIEHLKRAKEALGSEVALAEVVGVKQPSINYMLRKGSRVPAEWCLPIEAATSGRITRHQLRPDLWPEESTIPDAAAPQQGEAA